MKMVVNMENYIMGTFRQKIFSSDNGYVIGLVKIKDTDLDAMKDYVNKVITITGYFHELNENENYYFKGEETVHPKYGFQFNVSSYERVKPEDRDGVVAFLASDLFPGIGEKMAEKIVNTLGDKALDEILADESVLMLVPKLSSKKAKLIYETLIRYEESHKTIVYLTELGFIMRDALAIYNTYKSHTISVIEQNIYSIVDDIPEISFTKIDAIAHNMDLEPDSIERIKACLFYIMKTLTFKNGDLYLNFDEIYYATIHYLDLGLDEGYIAELLEELNYETKIVIKGDRYYLAELDRGVDNIVYRLLHLCKKKNNAYHNLDSLITELEESSQITYNDKQRLAITKAMQNNILIITGGPGTGKTMIIKAIVNLYQQLKKYNNSELISSLALLAPTGRASKRLSEATNLPASTIHRFLKWNKETNTFGINEYNPDFSQLVIVDEVSMIDVALMDSLFRGLTLNIQLVLVGDYNQLPSVGPGSLLKDLIDSKVIDTVELDTLYRQKEDSYIPLLAEEIKDDTLTDFTTIKGDYSFIPCDESNIIENLSKVCKQLVSKNYDYKNYQIMAPMYAGVNGIDNLNKILQKIFNPPQKTSKEFKYGDIIYRENDKVLQLVNDPDNNVYNGDIGTIVAIKTGVQTKSGKTEICIDFDGNIVTYTPKDLPNIRHGFIISIHKAQGSEFDVVIMPICHSYHRMLYRKLIYTGVTRAKKKLIIIGEPMAFEGGVHSNNEQVRKSDMVERLCEVSNNKNDDFL